jgi:predicted nucleotidyltransferase
MKDTTYASYIQRARRESEKQRKSLDARWEKAWNLARDASSRLKTCYGAEKVIVFGSLLHRERFRSDSDIDIAVSGIPPQQFFRAIYDVALGEKDFDIDVVDIEDCKPYIRRAIEQEGIVMSTTTS